MQSPNGPLNWVLIDSSMKLIEAGGGSVAEMSQFFDPKEVRRRSPSGLPLTLTLTLTLDRKLTLALT